jgi:hypothetical protein
MMAHRWLAHAERFGEIAGAHFGRGRDEAEQSESRWISERLEP